MYLKELFLVLLTTLLVSVGSVSFADDSGAGVEVVNVNTADAATIANTLVGVGYSRAKSIVDYREKHGKFYSAEELTAVKGIGQSTVQRNLVRITTE